MIVNITDLKKRRTDYVSYNIKFKNDIDRKTAIKASCNTKIPLYEDIASYLLEREDGSEIEDVAEILLTDDPFSDIASRLYDRFTTVSIEVNGEACVELVALFDVLLRITSNQYSSFVLYDNDDCNITESPRFVISK